MKCIAIAAAAALLAAGGGALAQIQMGAPDGMPPDIAEMLREIGPVIEVQRTGPAYAQYHETRPFEDLLLYEDVSYGPHERHAVDIFAEEGGASEKPVLVFVHGGGFAGGTKHSEGSPFYDNISVWAARNGMIGMQITYRLAPDHVYPAGIEDLDRFVDWAKENARIYGGDPDRIVLWGHSAGASHVADYLAANSDRTPVAGAVLMSGFYELGEEPSVWSVYYGEDPAFYPEMASLPGLVETDVPLLIVDALLDMPDANAQAMKLGSALVDAGKPVRHVRLPNHNHISEAYAVGTSDTSLTEPLRDFVMDVTAGSAE